MFLIYSPISRQPLAPGAGRCRPLSPHTWPTRTRMTGSGARPRFSLPRCLHEGWTDGRSSLLSTFLPTLAIFFFNCSHSNWRGLRCGCDLHCPLYRFQNKPVGSHGCTPRSVEQLGRSQGSTAFSLVINGHRLMSLVCTSAPCCWRGEDYDVVPSVPCRPRVK